MTTIEKLEKLIYVGFKETDRKLAEISKETDRKLYELGKETERISKETERISKETDRKLQETDRILTEKFQESKKLVDKLVGKWGLFVEGLVAPGIERLLKKRGITVTRIARRVKAKMNGNQMEIDILAVNKDCAVLVEVKSTLSVDDVNEHLERLKKFKTFFPEYKDYKAIGAVAGIVIEEGADRYAYKKGLFVIAQSGETVTILNDDKFNPKTW